MKQSSGTTNMLRGVSFTDAMTGTAVGFRGTILRTTDGGRSWGSQTSGTTTFLLGVSFTDATTGTAVGTGGTILRTTASIVTGFLPSFQSYWTGSHVEVSWRLIDIEGELTFDVSRRSGSSERYTQIYSPEIIRKSDEFIFVDRTTEPATTYSYLVTIIEDGNLVTSFETTTTTPSFQLALGQNHPNPFNPVTRIDFAVDQESPVYLAIYDVSGKLVRTLINRRMRSGSHEAEWDGRDNGGRAVASGIYFYRLMAGKAFRQPLLECRRPQSGTDVRQPARRSQVPSIVEKGRARDPMKAGRGQSGCQWDLFLPPHGWKEVPGAKSCSFEVSGFDLLRCRLPSAKGRGSFSLRSAISSGIDGF